MVSQINLQNVKCLLKKGQKTVVDIDTSAQAYINKVKINKDALRQVHFYFAKQKLFRVCFGVKDDMDDIDFIMQGLSSINHFV